jgi:hypothetical protein
MPRCFMRERACAVRPWSNEYRMAGAHSLTSHQKKIAANGASATTRSNGMLKTSMKASLCEEASLRPARLRG